MAATTVLSNAVRGSLSTPAFAISAGTPKFIQLALTSPTFATDPTLHWDIVCERSLDSGVTWNTYFTSTNVGGFGLAVQNVHWDGVACQLRANIEVPTLFTWGLTVEALVL